MCSNANDAAERAARSTNSLQWRVQNNYESQMRLETKSKEVVGLEGEGWGSRAWRAGPALPALARKVTP